MNNTQIKKPRPYILGGLGGIILGALLLYALEHFLTAPDQVNLFYRQQFAAFFVYVLLVISFLAILRGLSIAYRRWRYGGEL
ncbi:MAG: hypothetical protein WAS33_12045 [Candidatus Promineifilaceae bacterium]|jgi:hypothetical protein|nr:hypothetical protein [Anaerolineaceae bacterium]